MFKGFITVMFACSVTANTSFWIINKTSSQHILSWAMTNGKLRHCILTPLQIFMSQHRIEIMQNYIFFLSVVLYLAKQANFSM